jgi:hypothetical protein
MVSKYEPVNNYYRKKGVESHGVESKDFGLTILNPIQGSKMISRLLKESTQAIEGHSCGSRNPIFSRSFEIPLSLE